MKNATDIVNRLLAEFSKGAAGMAAALELLPDDFKFDGPMLVARSKAEFVEGLKAMGDVIPAFKMLKQFTDGDDVCSIYEFSAGGPKVLMAEWSHVKGGKIVQQRLVYDSAQMKPPQ